jgi:hypothetical protein
VDGHPVRAGEPGALAPAPQVGSQDTHRVTQVPDDGEEGDMGAGDAVNGEDHRRRSEGCARHPYVQVPTGDGNRQVAVECGLAHPRKLAGGRWD